MRQRENQTRRAREHAASHPRVPIRDRFVSWCRRPIVVCAIVLALGGAGVTAPSARAQDGGAPTRLESTADSAALIGAEALEAHLTRVIEDVRPSLVAVIGEWPQPAPGDLGAATRRAPPQISVASGFALAGGYIVTTQSVARNAVTFRIKPYRQPERIARLIAIDPVSRLCILRAVDTTGLRGVRVAAENRVHLGSWVLIVGTTGMTDASASFGTVSHVPDHAEDPESHYLGLNVVASPGASGAPVLDVRGEVVGVMLASLVTSSELPANGASDAPSVDEPQRLLSTGTSLAVPLDVLQGVVAMLQERGTVSRGYLGVQWDSEPPADSLLATTLQPGAHIWDVVPGGPAFEAHLRKGDVVTYCNGTPVRGGLALQAMIQQAAPGSVARLTVLRDGQPFTVSVHLGSLPSSVSPAQPGHPSPDDSSSPDDAPAR